MTETPVSGRGVQHLVLRPVKDVPILVWILGALAGLALASRTFQGDFLLNWDQVIGPDIPVPPGVWGLGPELPRRTPFYLPLALGSRLFGGPRTVGLLLVGLTMTAVAGTARLARPLDAGEGGGGASTNSVGRIDLSATIVGLAYGLSPFLLSRAAIGHLPLVAATAFLPWLLFEIQNRSERNLIRWAAAFGLLGSSGAVVGLIPIGLALIHRRKYLGVGPGSRQTVSPRWRTGGLVVLSQAAWVLPGLMAVVAGVPFPKASLSAFDLRLSGNGGLSRVIAGGGLFLEQEDVSFRAGTVAAVLGLLMLGTGVIGLRERWERRGTDVLLLGSLLGACLVFVTAIPGLSGGWHWLVSIGPFGVFREPHKFWPLLGLALLVGLASVLRRFCGDVLIVVSVATMALVLGSSWPGLFGADGRLVGVSASEEWQELHDSVSAEPGRLAVFPWRRYDDFAFSDGRTVLQPSPWILPGTILVSGDVGNSGPSVERREPLQQELADIDARVRAGQEVAPALVAQDIRWLLVMSNQEADFYQRLGREPGVTQVINGPDFQLYRLAVNENVLHWPGLAVPVRIASPVTSGESGTSELGQRAVAWDRSCERGWLLGWKTLPQDNTRCLIDSSGGVLWYPAALVSLAGLILTVLILVLKERPVPALPHRVRKD